MSGSMELFGGLEEYLAGHLGREVIAEFRCGSEEPVRKAGTLTEVKPGYLVLRDDMSLRDTVCSLEHLCFVTFYLSGTLPRGEASGSTQRAESSAPAQAAQPTGRTGRTGALHSVLNGRRADQP